MWRTCCWVVGGCLSLLLSPLVWAGAGVTWDQRESPEAVQRVTREFVELLDLGANSRLVGVARRAELRPIAESFSKGEHPAVLDAFHAYFFAKLRAPVNYGLTVGDVSPHTRGIAGGGWGPPIFDPQADPQKVIAQADLLMQGRLRQGEQIIELGAPGAVNWWHPYRAGQPIPRDKMPDVGVVHGRVFLPLAHAYLLTRDVKYLNRWREYVDDWSLNSDYIASLNLCEVPSVVNATSDLDLVYARVLGGLAATMPVDQTPLPPRIFAQVLTKVLRESALPRVAYLRSNCHNWTPSASGLLAALIYDEFTVSQFYFREAMRRGIQDHAVTQNLRDGSENQHCPWYNHNYLNVSGALRLFDMRDSLAMWREPWWIAQWRSDPVWRSEITDHRRQRVNFLIQLSTPQGEWPVPFRGGDRRQADRGKPGDSPAAYFDNQSLLRALAGDAAAQPSFDSNWFPYGGYNIVRSGWGPLDACGAMFSSPQPGSYGAYRSRSNNNIFGLNAFGQDLLIDDCVGHYMYVSSPLRVDGRQQFFHARDGIYKVTGLSGHKTYQASAWTEPAPWRWHASTRFNLMEGIYDGPYGNPRELENTASRYGPEEAEQPTLTAAQTISDVQHQRLVHYVREARLWIVTDRLTSKKPHRFEQVWMLPTNPGKFEGFEDQEITVDQARQVIQTQADRRTGKSVNEPLKANVTLYQFSSQPLTYLRKRVEKDPKNHYQMNSRAEFYVGWSGTDRTQVITAIQPRLGIESVLSNIEPIEGIDAQGFRASTTQGASVQFLSSTRGSGELSLGPVKAQAESLLLTSTGGLVLGATGMSIHGRNVELTHSDFEFALAGESLQSITPIFRPIDPVVIGPQRNVFTDSIDVTMTTRTPSVEIRYTLDNSDPTPQSTLYQGPFKLARSAVVKARAYRPGVTSNPPQTSGTHATAVSTAVFEREQLVPAVDASPLKPGLEASYWQDHWQILWHLTDQRTPAARGVAKDLFDLSLVPASNPPVGSAVAPRRLPFAIEYTGFLNVPEDGVYTFHAPREMVYPDTDAGYELRVFLGQRQGLGPLRNRVNLLNAWYPSTRLHALGTWSIALKKGLHPLRVFYLDYRADSVQRLNRDGLRPYVWPGVTPSLEISGPQLQRQPIPAGWLSHAATLDAPGQSANTSAGPRAAASTMTVVPMTAQPHAPAASPPQQGGMGFHNQMPTDAGWTREGSLPVKLVDDQGQKVVDLLDASDTEMCKFRLAIPKAQAQAMNQHGFQAELCFKSLQSGNDMLLIRLESMGTAGFNFERDAKNNRLVVSSFDPVASKQISGAVEGVDLYVTLKCVFEPRQGQEGDASITGKVTVFLENQPVYSFQTKRPERSPNAVELGGVVPNRQGHTRVAWLRITPRQTAPPSP